MKTRILRLSKVFPAYHPRKGELTNFRHYVESEDKIHTIRETGQWYKIADEVNNSEAILNLRQWSDKPFCSPLDPPFAILDKIGVQQINITRFDEDRWICLIDMNRLIPIDVLAKNDGLSIEDFDAWFAPKFKKTQTWSGVIIHFTDFRY